MAAMQQEFTYFRRMTPLKMVITCILFLGMLAGCDGKPGKYDIRDYVEANLKDAGSAEYRDEVLYTRLDRMALCGEVNSRNGFGGMAGYARFVAWQLNLQPSGGALLEPSITASRGEIEKFTSTYDKLCATESPIQ